MSTKVSLVGATIATAVAATASADVTYTFTDATWTGFNFTQLFGADSGSFVSGTLTGVSVNATLSASTSFTYADDLCIYVDVLPLSGGGLLQVGGFNSLSASQRYFWPNGGSSAPGTTVSGTVNLTTALSFSGTAADAAIWLGNGYGATGTSGTWSGSITLIGVNAIPAPGALALLGAVGLVGSRRRRA
jgi:hypothetical protein